MLLLICFIEIVQNFARLPKGSAGEVLTMNSGATAPEWSSSSGGVTISNNANNRVLTGDGTEYKCRSKYDI